jgi:hypothetical protein
MDPTSIISGPNAVVAALIVAMVSAARKAFPDFFRGPNGRRLLPFLPLVLGAGFGALGLCDTTMFRAPVRFTGIVVGVFCGAFGASLRTGVKHLQEAEHEGAIGGRPAPGRGRGRDDGSDPDERAPGA